MCETISVARTEGPANRSRNVLGMVLAFGLALAGGAVDDAVAQSAPSYPAKPIRVIVPLGAGSALDLVPRVVYQQVAKQLGQTMVIENRAGAGGSVGANVVAKASPDGYTILAASNLLATLPIFIKDVPFSVTGDLAGIAAFGYQPNLLVTAKSQGINSLQELVELSKRRPEGITFGGTGGSPNHLNGEHFKLTMGLNARVVIFRGSAELLTEVVAGRVDCYFSPMTIALPFVQDRQLVGLAVTSRSRSSFLPDVPTSFEQGYSNSEFLLWFGSWAPSGTPRDIIDRLHAETLRAIEVPEVKERLKQMAVEPLPLKPQEIDQRINSEMQMFSKIATDAGLIVK